MVDKLYMRNTVRRLTARYSEEQMTDDQIDIYLNLFMTLMLPEHFKNIKLTKPYVFTTIPNVDTYPFIYQNGLVTDGSGDPVPGNIQVTPPVYCQGYNLRYFQDKGQFYNRWPKLSVNQQTGTADGTAGPYTGMVPTGMPFLRGQMDIFDQLTESAVVVSVQDDTGFTYVLNDTPVVGSNTGNLIDSVGNIVGTINYLTGAYTFTSQTGVLPAGQPIYVSVVPYQPSRPVDVLFYNQQFVFRPVPMQVYQVEFQISQQPLDLIGDSSQPELNEWYLFICAGAAKLIFADFPDPDGLNYLIPIWQEQLQLVQRRTLKQLNTQRAATIFSTLGRPMSSYYLGTEYSGGIG